jgi:transposase
VLGELTEKQKQLIRILEIIRIEEFIKEKNHYTGRKAADRSAIARSFVAKMVYSIPETKMLRDRLITDKSLRSICGFDKAKDVPSESVFSRAFSEFSQDRLPELVHKALIDKTHRDRIVGHISRDSTKIEARERPVIKKKEKKKTKRGRPKKDEIRERRISRIEKQQSMTLREMLEDLPSACDVGTKINSKGYKESWRGYKLHIDVADGNIPISCIKINAITRGQLQRG